MSQNEYGLIALICILASLVFMVINYHVLQDLFTIFSIVAIIVGWWNGET